MKKSNQILILCMLFFSVIFYSCEAPVAAVEEKPDLEQLNAKLQAMEDAYAVSENNKNTDGMNAYYAENAKSMPANEPTVVGKAAILERHESNIASDTTENQVQFEVLEVFADGDLVIEIGRSITTDADGNQTTGKYLSLFEEQDGKLVCIRDIWNLDAPIEN